MYILQQSIEVSDIHCTACLLHFKILPFMQQKGAMQKALDLKPLAKTINPVTNRQSSGRLELLFTCVLPFTFSA